MNLKNIVFVAVCAVLIASLCACSGEMLQQDAHQQQGTGALTPGTLGTNTSVGEIGALSPSDSFANAEHLLSVRVLKTGKSDCILITLNDTVILMDTADTDDYTEISKMLRSLGITRIDHLILTHFDNDHIGSAAKVIETFEVVQVYMPDYVRDSGLYRSLIESLEKNAARTTVQRLQDDCEIDLSAGKLWINVSRVYPDLSHEQPVPEDNMDNDLSLICGLSLGDFSALFMGDAEKQRCEDFLAQEQYAGQYDFVKLPHHGNYTKELREILLTTDMQYGIICTDSFENIENSTVKMMRDLNARTYYSYNGTILLRTDGTIVECTQ